MWPPTIWRTKVRKLTQPISNILLVIQVIGERLAELGQAWLDHRRSLDIALALFLSLLVGILLGLSVLGLH